MNRLIVLAVAVLATGCDVTPRCSDGQPALTYDDWEACEERLKAEAHKERRKLLATEPGRAPDAKSLHKLQWLNDQIHEAWLNSTSYMGPF